MNWLPSMLSLSLAAALIVTVLVAICCKRRRKMARRIKANYLRQLKDYTPEEDIRNKELDEEETASSGDSLSSANIILLPPTKGAFEK